MNQYRRGSFIALILISAALGSRAQSGISPSAPEVSYLSQEDPASCAANGSISLNGLLEREIYNVRYALNGKMQDPQSIAADSYGAVVISKLPSGKYTDIHVALNGIETSLSDTIILRDNAQRISIRKTDATDKYLTDGSIDIKGLQPYGGYSVAYALNGVADTTPYMIASADGELSLKYLSGGTYGHIKVIKEDCSTEDLGTLKLAYGAEKIVSTKKVKPTETKTATSVNKPQHFTANAVSNSPLCEGSSVLFSVVSNVDTSLLSYNWSGPNNFKAYTANPFIADAKVKNSGAYTLVVSDGNHTSHSVIKVQVAPIPATPTVNSNSPICMGNTLKIASSYIKGANYYWTGPSGFSTNTQNIAINNANSDEEGLYTLSVAYKECVAKNTVSVAVKVLKTIEITKVEVNNPSICQGINGSLKLEGLKPGVNYSIKYKKNKQAQAPKMLMANAGGQLTIAGLSAGVYEDISVTVNDCSANSVGPYTITDPMMPATPVISNNAIVNANESIKLSATGNANGVSYTWIGPGFSAVTQNPIINNAQSYNSGDYYVTATKNGCNSATVMTKVQVSYAAAATMPTPKTSIVVKKTSEVKEVKPPEEIKLSATRNEICVNEEVTISVAGNGTRKDLHMDVAGAIIVKSNYKDSYTLRWNTEGEKPVSLFAADDKIVALYTIDVRRAPMAHIETQVNTEICSGDVLVLTASNDAGNDYTWYPEKWFDNNRAANASAKIEQSGYIKLKVRDAYGCTNSDSTYISTRQCCDMPMPNAFSPNGDGRNDVFRIIKTGQYQLVYFMVRNRWGQVVFETRNESVGWDGTKNGVPQEMGTYTYFIKYRCGNKIADESGDVVLMR